MNEHRMVEISKEIMRLMNEKEFTKQEKFNILTSLTGVVIELSLFEDLESFMDDVLNVARKYNPRIE